MRVGGFTPTHPHTHTETTIFNAPFVWIDSVEQKETMKCSNLPGIVAFAVIPLMGRWTL